MSDDCSEFVNIWVVVRAHLKIAIQFVFAQPFETFSAGTVSGRVSLKTVPWLPVLSTLTLPP